MTPTPPRPHVDVWALAARGRSGEPLFERDRHGRPLIRGREDLCVSVSHTEGMTLVAAGKRCRVGVDVEAIRERGLDRLPGHALTAREQQDLVRNGLDGQLEAFLSYWTRKEALLKAAGLGLSVEPNLIELPPPHSSSAVLAVPPVLGDPDSWSLRELRIPGFVAAVAAEERSFSVQLISAGPTIVRRSPQAASLASGRRDDQPDARTEPTRPPGTFQR